MDVSIVSAQPDDVSALAALHAESWQTAYRGLLPAEFLAGPVVDDRLAVWRDRMANWKPDRQLVLKAVADDVVVGFGCVLLDAEPAWGARLDNLHVRPELMGTGIGWRLFHACRDWVKEVTPRGLMHLWVIEDNSVARRFYARQGGVVAEREVREIVTGVHVAELRYVWR